MRFQRLQAFNGLDVRTLRLFMAAVEGGNLTYAARVNHVALGAASRRISNFELLMGKPLLKRHARSVTLTQTGQVVADSVGRILEELNALGNLSYNSNPLDSKSVRLLANSITILEHLPDIIRQFKETSPDVKIEVQESRSWETEHALRQDCARIAFISRIENPEPVDGFHHFEFLRQRFVLVTHATHPLAKKKSVKIADILDYDFIGLPPASVFLSCVQDEARLLGKVLRMPIEVSSNLAACQMVSTGVGITVAPKLIVDKLKKGFDLRSIKLEGKLKPLKTMVYHVAEEKLNVTEVKLLHFLRTYKNKNPSITFQHE
jgi:DNA-binding transcriptional LysR family regulator